MKITEHAKATAALAAALVLTGLLVIYIAHCADERPADVDEPVYVEADTSHIVIARLQGENEALRIVADRRRQMIDSLRAELCQMRGNR